jgi:tRNA(adenine34) deaminase
MQDSDKMALTLKLAQKALRNGELPIAAIIFNEDHVIAKSYTSEIKDHRFLVHAELKALFVMDRLGFSIAERRSLCLFTTLEPCVMCFGAMMSSFIGEVIYSLSAPDDGATKLLNFDHFSGELVQRQLPKIGGGVCKEAAKELWQAYLQVEKRKYLRAFAETVLASN